MQTRSCAADFKRDDPNGTSAAINRRGVAAKRNGFAILVHDAKEKCRGSKVRKSVSNR